MLQTATFEFFKNVSFALTLDRLTQRDPNVKQRPLFYLTLLTSLLLHSTTVRADDNTDWGDWGLDSDQLIQELDRDDSPFEAIPELEAPRQGSARERRPLSAQEQAIFSELDNSDLSDYPAAEGDDEADEDDEAFSLLEQLEQLEQRHNATGPGDDMEAGDVEIYIEDGQLVIEPLNDEGDLDELDPDSARVLIDALDNLNQDGDSFTIEIDGTEVELDREDLESLEELIDLEDLDDFEALIDELEDEFQVDNDDTEYDQAGEYAP